jgi:hypothetical protein
MTMVVCADGLGALSLLCRPVACVIVVDHGHDIGVSSEFRHEFYRCLPARADALFELTDAVLCADGPVKTLVDLTFYGSWRLVSGG